MGAQRFKWESCGCWGLFLTWTAARLAHFTPQPRSHSQTHLTTNTIVSPPLPVLPPLRLNSKYCHRQPVLGFPSWHSIFRLTFPLPHSRHLTPCLELQSSFFLSPVGARTPPSGLRGGNCPSLSCLSLPELQNTPLPMYQPSCLHPKKKETNK